MGEILGVLSGKGGVGKSTVACCLARAFAHRGCRTVVVELDGGLRGLDIMLGLSDTVFDLDDLLQGRCSIEQAIQQVGNSSLYAICAPVELENEPSQQDLATLCTALLSSFDRVVLDAPAGCRMSKRVAAVATQVLLVVTPDPVCVRDASLLRPLLLQEMLPGARLQLLVNRANRKWIQKNGVGHLDAVIDQVGAQLVGVIPEEEKLAVWMARGCPLEYNSRCSRIFLAIASRLEGEDLPLLCR